MIRYIVLIIFLVLSFVAINPQFDTEGVAIRNIDRGSAAALAGIEAPDNAVAPTQREVIQEVNGNPVTDRASYLELINDLEANQSFTMRTDQGAYRLEAPAENPSDIGVVIYDVPSNNIRKGLDLSGGTRVILQPESAISPEDLELVMDNIGERLNVFGLSDIIVRSSRDLAGNDFIVVEIAGANKQEVRELLGSQGFFEARINNQSVFTGGEDIVFVCNQPECSGIDSRTGGCQGSSGSWVCPYSFSITLSAEAARNQATITNQLSVLPSGSLSSPLDLYLDGELVDSLSIASDLKGRAVTDISISGSGEGASRDLAVDDALDSMKQLQTILVTGSLPVKLDIVKMDAISPVLGAAFVKNALLMALVVILAVAIVIFIKYRELLLSLPIIVTMLSEGFIILGFASLIGWNLDLAAIAGILIAIGTGVDDQIVIIDEALNQKTDKYRSWKDRIMSARFIIMAAYATTVVAMLPLFFAGAGLLRGFAFTTIIGVSIGVFITRPAFATFIERNMKKEE